MPYTTISERSGMVRLLEALLREKFGEEGAALIPAIWELNDADKFEALGRRIVTASSLEEVRRACAVAGRRPSSAGRKGRRAPKAKE